MPQTSRKFTPRSVAPIIAGYFLALLALVVYVNVAGVKLFASTGFWSFPTVWLLVVCGGYYIAPFVIAIVYARLTRTGKDGFIAIVVGILCCQLFYSAGVWLLRQSYLSEWQRHITFARQAAIKITNCRQDMVDAENDGLANEIVLTCQLDTSELPDGYYEGAFRLTQAAAPGAVTADYYPFVRKKAVLPDVTMKVRFDSSRLNGVYQSGSIDVDFGLRENLRLSPYGRMILNLSRWAPLLKVTTWDGSDPEIYEDVIDLRAGERVYSFPFDANKLQRPQVIFKRFIGDQGVDRDGDSRFDALVVSMEVDSIYSGPIYFQGSIEGGAGFVLTQTILDKNVGRLDFVIDSKILRQAGKAGPYRIREFAFINNDPHCPNMRCEIKNLPAFSVYLDDYVTQPYTLAQF